MVAVVTHVVYVVLPVVAAVLPVAVEFVVLLAASTACRQGVSGMLFTSCAMLDYKLKQWLYQCSQTLLPA